MLYKETVEAGTLDLIMMLMEDEVFKNFYLVGGVALSLKLGHRKSVDIDLFTHEDFDAAKLKAHLERQYKAERAKAIGNGVFCFINNVKVDLISHQYAIAKPLERVEGIRMLSLDFFGRDWHDCFQ